MARTPFRSERERERGTESAGGRIGREPEGDVVRARKQRREKRKRETGRDQGIVWA